MRVDVHDRESACSIEPQTGVAVISISGPGQPAPLKVGWFPVLRLEFDDVVKPVAAVPNLVLFAEKHVQAIHEFVEFNLDLDFLVHCDAGVSRSTAVGIFLRDCHDADLHTHVITVRQAEIAANNRVLRGLRRKFWIKQMEGETKV